MAQSVFHRTWLEENAHKIQRKYPAKWPLFVIIKILVSWQFACKPMDCLFAIHLNQHLGCRELRRHLLPRWKCWDREVITAGLGDSTIGGLLQHQH